MNSQKLLELLSQRRVWAGLIGVTGFILAMFAVDIPNAEGLIDLATNFGAALAPLITASLALLSYFSPKK